MCHFQPLEAVTVALQHCHWTVSMKENLYSLSAVPAWMLETIYKKIQFSVWKRKDYVPCADSCCFFPHCLWSYQPSNLIILQIRWKWSLLWQGNCGGDRTIQFLSQTRGGNLPLISFRSHRRPVYLQPACYLHLCFCTGRRMKWGARIRF